MARAYDPTLTGAALETAIDRLMHKYAADAAAACKHGTWLATARDPIALVGN